MNEDVKEVVEYMILNFREEVEIGVINVRVMFTKRILILLE